MHAEAEITFDCSKCGQHLSVDANGAGQAVSCPICGELLTVPQEDVLARIAAITYSASGDDTTGRRPPERAHDATEPEVFALREQLVESVRLRSQMARELIAARTEMEAVQAQLRRAADENSQLASSLRQLQGDHRELNASCSQLREQCEELRSAAAARNAGLAERAETLREAQWALEKSEKRCLGVTQEVAAVRAELASVRNQYQRVAEENSRLSNCLEQLQADNRELKEAYSELCAQCEELRSTAAAKDAGLAERAETLRELQWALEKSEKRCLGLTQELTRLQERVKPLQERVALVGTLEAELANLRRDFAASAEAQECNRLRARAEGADEKRRLQAHEIENLRAEIESLRQELKESHERCKAAEQLAEQLSVAKVQSDNEVLRSLLGRQRAELEACYRELNRFRRSELGLRLVYALFALGLLGIAAFAMQVLPSIADVL